MLEPLEKFRDAPDTHKHTHTTEEWRQHLICTSSRISVLLATGGKHRWRKKTKTLKGQKRVKGKIGTKMHCQNPRGEAKGEIIILNQTPALLFGIRSSLHDIIYHRRTPSLQTDDSL